MDDLVVYVTVCYREIANVDLIICKKCFITEQNICRLGKEYGATCLQENPTSFKHYDHHCTSYRQDDRITSQFTNFTLLCTLFSCLINNASFCQKFSSHIEHFFSRQIQRKFLSFKCPVWDPGLVKNPFHSAHRLLSSPDQDYMGPHHPK